MRAHNSAKAYKRGAGGRSSASLVGYHSLELAELNAELPSSKCAFRRATVRRGLGDPWLRYPRSLASDPPRQFCDQMSLISAVRPSIAMARNATNSLTCTRTGVRATRSTTACMVLSLSQEAHEITFKLPRIETDSSVLHAENAALIND